MRQAGSDIVPGGGTGNQTGEQMAVQPQLRRPITRLDHQPNTLAVADSGRATEAATQHERPRRLLSGRFRPRAGQRQTTGAVPARLTQVAHCFGRLADLVLPRTPQTNRVHGENGGRVERASCWSGAAPWNLFRHDASVRHLSCGIGRRTTAWRSLGGR